ncbi:hypothetical protein B0T13DRAFT_446166 [Neurospora crassa]|nr:hypothetical protein B0T13DRAFT_446166 [Neurospora crassa]
MPVVSVFVIATRWDEVITGPSSWCFVGFHFTSVRKYTAPNNFLLRCQQQPTLTARLSSGPPSSTTSSPPPSGDDKRGRQASARSSDTHHMKSSDMIRSFHLEKLCHASACAYLHGMVVIGNSITMIAILIINIVIAILQILHCNTPRPLM